MRQGSKGQILPKNQDFRKELEIAIFEFFYFLHEVRGLKALQTGIEVALSKYLFYGQLGGQKVYECLQLCLSHFLSGGPLVPRGLFKELQPDTSIEILPADKGRSTVILNRWKHVWII